MGSVCLVKIILQESWTHTSHLDLRLRRRVQVRDSLGRPSGQILGCLPLCGNLSRAIPPKHVPKAASIETGRKMPRYKG